MKTQNSSILKKSMLIRFKSEVKEATERGWSFRHWVVLPVTKEDFKKGINADSEGLYAFGGMWYGRNPMKRKSYGKISPVDDISDIEIVRTFLMGMKVNEIQKLVN